MEKISIKQIKVIEKRWESIKLDETCFLIENSGKELGVIVSPIYLKKYIIVTEKSKKISLNEFIENIINYCNNDVILVNKNEKNILVYLSVNYINPELFVKIKCPSCGSDMEEILQLDNSIKYICLNCAFKDIKNAKISS